MYCKADFKSIAKCKKWLCAAVFSLFLKNMRRAAWPVLQSRCKALSAPPQSTPKNTKTGRKSVGFLILTQAPKCTRSHRFPPQKHPKNGFVLRFAGKNSFLQVRSSHVLILSALLHLFFIRFNNSLVKIVVSGGSVVIFCFHADRYAVWMKIWVSSACCTGHKTGSFFVIAEMKLLFLPCTKVTSRLNRCWSCCAVPRRNLPREEGDELTTIRAALERTSRANSEMRQSLQNNILALREYFTLNAIQGIFRSKEIFDDVCRGIGLLFEYPYFLVCCVYTGKSMVFGEVSPVQFSELMSQASPSDMQSVFHSGIEEGYSYGPAVCPRCGGQMDEKAYWYFC